MFLPQTENPHPHHMENFHQKMNCIRFIEKCILIIIKIKNNKGVNKDNKEGDLNEPIKTKHIFLKNL